ncbi:MAG: hypothetical protein WBB43_02025 [Limnoraphis sp.]
MNIQPNPNSIRCYFNQDKVCIGVVSNDPFYPTFAGDYWASEYFQLPPKLNPVGLTAEQIQQAQFRHLNGKPSLKFISRKTHG